MQNRKTDVCSRLTHWLYCLGSVACAVLGPRLLYAHQAPDRSLNAVRLEDARPQIDGVLSDPVWQQAPVFTGFVQREPEEGQPASEKTTVTRRSWPTIRSSRAWCAATRGPKPTVRVRLDAHYDAFAVDVRDQLAAAL